MLRLGEMNLENLRLIYVELADLADVLRTIHYIRRYLPFASGSIGGVINKGPPPRGRFIAGGGFKLFNFILLQQ